METEVRAYCAELMTQLRSTTPANSPLANDNPNHSSGTLIRYRCYIYHVDVDPDRAENVCLVYLLQEFSTQGLG
jgi:hypothetical protein